jgi:hypothetical protein
MSLFLIFGIKGEKFFSIKSAKNSILEQYKRAKLNTKNKQLNALQTFVNNQKI